MPLDFDIFPDSEYLAIRILKDAVTAGFFTPLTPRIDTKLPPDPVWASGLVLVTRIGGIPKEEHRLDNPNLQIDTWSDDKKTSHDLAQLARVALHRVKGSVFTTPPAVLTDVKDSLGIHYQWDSLNLKPRYVLGVYFTVHKP